ncbi:MAG: F0F1 ATP synthase subunit A [Acidobacteriia bacterium]|nr:F0F1 ATP synthase subunit A [Terriglobia bacterium]
MHITPDQIVLWQWNWVHLNATIVYTWIVMLLLTLVSWLVSRRLAEPDQPRLRWQTALEVIVEIVRGQIREICPEGADTLLPFVGTLFLYIAASNVLEIAPVWHAPTGSLSTTAALAISVGVAVPLFGILQRGLIGYFRHYVRPAWVMLPFHLLAETTRNLALAVRLFGNIMSESMVAALMLAVAPLFIPVLMQVLGLVVGLIQAYIFAILGTVYIAAAVHREQEGAK